MIEEPKKGIFRVLELIPEIIGWVQIFISPFLIGVIIGYIVILAKPNTTGIVIGVAISITGFVVGVIWATKQWRGKGTVWFMSRVIATPELDNSENENTKNSKDEINTANSQ